MAWKWFLEVPQGWFKGKPIGQSPRFGLKTILFDFQQETEEEFDPILNHPTPRFRLWERCNSMLAASFASCVSRWPGGRKGEVLGSCPSHCQSQTFGLRTGKPSARNRPLASHGLLASLPRVPKTRHQVTLLVSCEVSLVKLRLPVCQPATLPVCKSASLPVSFECLLERWRYGLSVLSSRVWAKC